MKPNDKLHLLYKKHWPLLHTCMKDFPDLSGPTVMHISDEYFKSRKRLLIVGQQTFGWWRGNLDYLLKRYQEFNFGEEYYSSPFWNITSKVADILGVSRFAIAWTNLVKCDYKKNRPSPKIEARIQGSFPVLEKEISILSPDMVLFFTGPSYDERLVSSLPGSSFESVSNYARRYLARISNPLLPENSFRTYHPNYLRRSGKEKNFLNYIKRISDG